MKQKISLLILLGGCSILEPQAKIPSDSVSYNPPTVYNEWWKDMEICSGLKRDIKSIHWYMVPNGYSFELNNQQVAGIYVPDYAIVIAELNRENPIVVKHEMLHALLWDTVDDQINPHPAEYFVGKCGKQLTNR